MSFCPFMCVWRLYHKVWTWFICAMYYFGYMTHFVRLMQFIYRILVCSLAVWGIQMAYFSSSIHVCHKKYCHFRYFSMWIDINSQISHRKQILRLVQTRIKDQILRLVQTWVWIIGNIHVLSVLLIKARTCNLCHLLDTWNVPLLTLFKRNVILFMINTSNV